VLQDNAANYPRPPAVRDRLQAIVGDDLVGMLVDARDEDGARLTDKQVRDETISFFIAGHATIASALTWTWYLLSTHPESWRRLRAEVDEVLGGRPPGTADLPRLRYAGMVVQEAIRLYPPIYLLLRRALADDEVGGYHIPAGADIALCPYVTHRHPGFWDNPEGFDPERFAPELPAGATGWPSSPSPAAPGGATARASRSSSSPWWWPWSASATA
jgi:cytochrome P450